MRLLRHSRGNPETEYVEAYPTAPPLDSTCAVKRLEFPAGESPARQGSLQPEAVGAAVEVTKLSKPSMVKGRFSGSANRQAVT